MVSAPPLRCVSIALYDISGSLLCQLRADESSTVLDVKRRLSAGEAEGSYLVATALPLSDLHLLAVAGLPRLHQELRDAHRLSEHGWYNEELDPDHTESPYYAHHVTFTHLPPDGGHVEESREKKMLDAATHLRELRVELKNFPTATFSAPPPSPCGLFGPHRALPHCPPSIASS